MRKLLAIMPLALLCACSGIRQTNNTFSTHAESFRVLGFPIPEDDQAKARSLVPQSAEIVSVHTTPADWTSLVGVLGNLFWFHQTNISGTKASGS